MQTIRTYLSNNSIVGILSDSDLTINTIDKTYFARPVKLYTGLNNPVTIICLDDTQSPVDLSNISLTVNVFDSSTDCLILSKSATNSANVLLGTSTVTFTNTDFANVDPGFYQIGIVVTDPDYNQTPLFINDNFGSLLTSEFLPGPVIEANIPPICLNFLSTNEPIYGNLAGIRSQLITMLNQPIQGNTEFTLQANLVSFTGNIHMQAACTSTDPAWASPGGYDTSIAGRSGGNENDSDDYGPPTTYGFWQGPGGNYGDFADLEIWNYVNYTGPVTLSASGCVGWLAVFLHGSGANGVPMSWPKFAPANSAITNAELRIGNVQ